MFSYNPFYNNDSNFDEVSYINKPIDLYSYNRMNFQQPYYSYYHGRCCGFDDYAETKG